uniref:Uncharacterized protein n=1 Tax=viral metagenome TaxID=1070528 RepID=A0A6C0EKC0_9ZZZZ
MIIIIPYIVLVTPAYHLRNNQTIKIDDLLVLMIPLK